MEPLIKWLQVITLLILDLNNKLEDPPIQLGNEEIAFPAWRGSALQDFRQSLLEEDFLHWFQDPVSNKTAW